MNATEAVKAAARQLAELTGRTPESVLGVERDGEEEGWTVTIEALEMSRVPNSMDLLGSYVVRLDKDGELVGYKRTRRYPRGAADEEGS